MDSVKVALRIRPLVNSELDLGCRSCIERTPKEPQVAVGKGHQIFTYNYVFDEMEGQSNLYNDAVKSLIDNLFKGYNVTILAYGQTGSGKTYSMGTNYSGDGELGVIPRAIYDIFQRINSDTDHDYQVTVSFLELYNESLYDLLTQKPREQSIIEMREHQNGLVMPGLTELAVHTPDDTLERLQEGSSGRVVGSTNMNAQSSRSHAIFTINIKIQPKGNLTETITSKFHLVDLAGSERSKKTGATGDRFKEGVNINKGLLILGNVISQLGEGNHSYINYRDSKLTRLLQDSLGGNSVTLMIACVSPADYNQDETLSTLRYADRAKKIKNKPVVNQDPQHAEISRLKKQIEELRLQMIGEVLNVECPPEHKEFQEQLSEVRKQNHLLTKALAAAVSRNTNMFEKALSVENAETSLNEKVTQLLSMSQSQPLDEDQWKKLKEKIIEVGNQEKVIQQEIFAFESVHNSEERDEEEGDDDVEMQDGAITQFRQEHIMSQAKRNDEIFALSKNLMWKEELMTRLAEHAVVMPGVTEAGIQELKKQLDEAQHEKEELQKQIRSSSNHAQTASAKVAETRRKRMQELESRVSNLSKKVLEQERIIKMKEKSDEKILKLKQEIMSMKQLKIRLIQQMKVENERFKNFKAVKDREVCQLKSQNMKRQNQLKKMEQMHTLQQNVLRRKLEAAAAANKRIMAALEKQKAAREKRMKAPSTEKIKERMSEELELMESEYQAQRSLSNLLQDRASYTKELSVIKESLAESTVSEEEKVKLRFDAKQIEHELELRSCEISDLQQKLLDIRQDDRNKNNWDMLQSMSDAKYALTFLFNLTTEKIKDNLNIGCQLGELQDQYAETDERLAEYQSKLHNLEYHHTKDLERMEKECEEKVSLFMRITADNIENTAEGPMSKTFRIQTQELEKLEVLRTRITELEEENEKLTKSRDYPLGPKAEDPFGKFLEERNDSFIGPKRKKKTSQPIGEKDQTFVCADEEFLSQFDDSKEIDLDDTENDPDWRKTPIHKRIKHLKANKKTKIKTSLLIRDNDQIFGFDDGGFLTPPQLDNAKGYLHDIENDPDWQKTPIHQTIKQLKAYKQKCKLGKRSSEDTEKCSENCSSERAISDESPKRQRHVNLLTDINGSPKHLPSQETTVRYFD